jgi:putative thiamine transport system permease protein
MLGPVAAGLYGTILPALNHLPSAGLTGPSLAPFAKLFDWPGLSAAIRLSITTGVGSTLIALIIVTLLTAGWSGTRSFRALERLLSPLLSVPHAAAAFGLAFLIAPSGWIARATSPWLTGWERPPDLLIVQDQWGLAMIAGLVAKEVPFLLLMTLAALGQTDAQRSVAVAQALGYSRLTGWLKTVFPRVYAQIKLPVYVVLAYAMSTVDVAVILGPNTPPPLSVQIVKWMSEPNLAMRTQAAAAALLQLGLVVGALIFWRLGEMLIGRLGRHWAEPGTRRQDHQRSSPWLWHPFSGHYPAWFRRPHRLVFRRILGLPRRIAQQFHTAKLDAPRRRRPRSLRRNRTACSNSDADRNHAHHWLP